MTFRIVFLLFVLMNLLRLAPATAGENPPECTSCQIQIDSLDHPYKLHGKWLFTRDDSPQNKDVNLDTSAWRLAKAPGPWKGVYNDNKVFPVGWYRGNLEFNPGLVGQEVVLLVNAYMGRVNVYVDGKEVYRRPNNINVERYYSTQAIPVRFTISQAHQVVAIRVDTPLMTGVYQLPFELRKYDMHDAGLVAYQILGGEARLVISYVILLFGFFFILVYSKTRYALYLVCALCSIFSFPFFAGTADIFLGLFSPETMLYLTFPGIFGLFLFYIFSQFFHKFTPKINWIAGSLIAAMGLTIGSMAFHPNLELFQHIRSIYITTILSSGFGTVYMLVRGVQHGKPGARILLAGGMTVLMAGVNDFLLAMGFINSYALLFFGAAVAVATMLYVASNAFANTFTENKKLAKNLTVLNENLESQVQQRTAALEAVNQRLAEEYARKEVNYAQAVEDLYNHAPCGYHALDADGVIMSINDTELRWLGYTREEVVGKLSIDRLFTPESAARFPRYFSHFKEQGQISDLEMTIMSKDGSALSVLLAATVVRDDAGQFVMTLTTVFDISERKKAEEKINELAFYDQLTGLPNRALLLDRLRQTMNSSSRDGNYGALLLIDLDNFKTLNDTLGHDRGDLLLKQVAQRLATCVRAADTVARLGGDEFVVMLASLSRSERDAATRTEGVGEKILRTLNEIYQLKDVAHHSTPSIGVTLFTGDQVTIDDLLKQADLAMYKSKNAGRNALRFFDPDMESDVMKRATLEKDLRVAVQEQQFLLHYQAQVAGDHLTGVEVLVRWQHPQRGMVSPFEFIPLAEETGLILPLGQWVLETACTQLAEWATRPEFAHLTVAVNVSAVQFRQPDFVNMVLSVLKNTCANPKRLKLELTESMLVSNVDEIIEKMFALKARGVGFSLDDFGTGYSSLAYLKRLPLDQLKIDQSFVRDVLIDPKDAAIARTIVTLAQSLSLGVIAEGVETEAQRDFLANVGCHAYQGYFFSRPLPLEGFEKFAQRV